MDSDDEGDGWLMGIEADVFTKGSDFKSSYVAKRRGWLPDFHDQIDRGVNSYALRACGEEVTVGIAWRENGTGSDLWDSALVVAGYLEHSKSHFPSDYWAGKRVVELGSGTGALGLLVSKLGVSEVFLTDLPECCPLLEKNALANGCLAAGVITEADRGGGVTLETDEGGGHGRGGVERGGVVRVAPLYWGEAIPAVLEEGPPVDLIIGTDLLLPYAPELFAPLCRSIADLLRIGNCPSGSATATSSSGVESQPVAVLAYEERFDVSNFFLECIGAGLEVNAVENSELHPTYQDPGKIFVLRITLQ